MKTKVKKYLITYLSLVLILSNFSYATTLAFCKMSGDDTVCPCSLTGSAENNGPVLKKAAKTCCETKIVELSNRNILEVLNSYTGIFLHPEVELNHDAIALPDTFSDSNNDYNGFFYKPPSCKIPVLHSSLLI
jgi:hypothetical protein